jgi:hypothetical protein
VREQGTVSLHAQGDEVSATLDRGRVKQFALLGGSMFAGSTDAVWRSFWLDWLVMCAAVVKEMDRFHRGQVQYRLNRQQQRTHLPWVCEGCAVNEDSDTLPRGWGVSGVSKFPQLGRTNQATWCHSCIVNGMV